jgi:hypothetical protein
MRWNTNFPGVVLLILANAFCLLLLPSRFQAATERSCEARGYCFVTPEGAGARNGVDWNNAYADLPNALTRGVMYFVAGSENSYADHVFNDPDRGTAEIYIYKAIDCAVVPSAPYCGTINPARVAGWQPSFGTNTAKWIPTPDPDPETRFFPTIWHFCSDYYTVDGVTGSTAPASPGGQGFVIGAQNQMFEGMVAIGNDATGCGSPAGLTNISFSHMEVKGTGPMPYYQVGVTGCSYAAGEAAISTAASLNGVGGDRVGGWDSSGRNRLFTNAAASSMSSTQVVVPAASNPCPMLAWVGLDFFPLAGFEGINHANLEESVTNITIQYCYVHDLGATITAYNGYNISLLHNYLAGNRSTPTEHSSILQFTEGSGSDTSGPITIAYNFILDGTGTAWISHLPTNGGTLDGLYVYGNIFACHSGAESYQCGVGHANVSDNAGFTVIQNLRFYNNTVAGNIGPVGVSLLNARSTAMIENNLFYDNGGDVKMQANGGLTHDYNTLLNSSAAYGTTCNSSLHETCVASGANNPFANDARFDFHLVVETNSAAQSRVAVTEGKYLPPPYNIDFDGQTRGANGTWARGAYGFNDGPQRPANLKTTVR